MIRVSSFGADPCHLIVDAESRVIYSSNYSSGTLCAITLLENGQLDDCSREVIDFNSSLETSYYSSDPDTDTVSHIHEVTLAAGNTLMINDLGIVICLISSLSYDRNCGKMELLHTVSSLRADESNVDMSAAELQLSKDGLFVSHRLLTNLMLLLLLLLFLLLLMLIIIRSIIVSSVSVMNKL